MVYKDKDRERQLDNERHRKRRAENPEAVRQYFREYHAKNIEKIAPGKKVSRAKSLKTAQDFVCSEKNKPCTDCGHIYPSDVMEFDHIGNDKSFNIAVAVRNGMSIERIKKEIAKCELVCANCHRIRTMNRRNKIMVDVA